MITQFLHLRVVSCPPFGARATGLLRGRTTDRRGENLRRARGARAALPAIVFPSGDRNALLATAHLSTINRLPGPKPGKIDFSYGRALQDRALVAWHGREENPAAGQSSLCRRAMTLTTDTRHHFHHGGLR